MNDYFAAAVPNLKERAQYLIGMIPRSPGRERAELERICKERVRNLVTRLDRLFQPDLLLPENQTIRLRLFRRIVDELEEIESVGIATLYRWRHDTDGVLNGLADRMAGEIKYPISAPIVSGTSQNYYLTYTGFNLICVPMADHRFLLCLPDVYHELAHVLLAEENDPHTSGFRSAQLRMLRTAESQLSSDLERYRRRRGPEPYYQYLQNWIRCWRLWSVELVCDLFALYTLGPAFAWTNYHLCATRADDPFELPLYETATHPPDGLRMQVLLLGLEHLEFKRDAEDLQAKWAQLLAITGARPSPEYLLCFPEQLLQQVALSAYEGTVSMGCSIATPDMSEPIRTLLSEAWRQFWRNPQGYCDWEHEQVSLLIQSS